MFKQRFVTMMHVFASVNYNDTFEEIKHIKSENKKKRSKKDQKWSTPLTQRPFQENKHKLVMISISLYTMSLMQIKKHEEQPHVRIYTVPTAQYSPEINQKRCTIA